MRWLSIMLIKLYRYCISPAMPPSCRFTPTCSEYAMEAVEKHGFCGIIMAMKRIVRCHPFAASGHDPVK